MMCKLTELVSIEVEDTRMIDDENAPTNGDPIGTQYVCVNFRCADNQISVALTDAQYAEMVGYLRRRQVEV